MSNSHQVVIIGGGPVGLGLAVDLGQRGIAVCVVERYLQPQPIPKGQNLTQRTMEHFLHWGAEAPLRAARTVPRSYGIGGLIAYRTLLSDYHYDWMQRELVRPYYFTDNERLPQYQTEAVLRRRVAELRSVEVLYGWQAETIEQTDEAVSILITERGGQGRRWLRADYVVGCDGSRSITRDRAGITQTLSDHDRVMVLLVFKSQKLHTLLERYPNKQFYCTLTPELEGYWMFFGRVDLGTTWFFHAPVPPGTTRDNYDFKAYVHKAVGETFDVAFEHIGFWDLRFAVANTYRAGRVFIAGDAAHSHPPYGGYGINIGFEDARNLGWKLAAALNEWGGSGLLDGYSLERQPVFASAATDFIEKSIHVDRDFLAAHDPLRDKAAFEAAWARRASGTASEVGSFEPNYEGSPVVFGPEGGRCSSVGQHSFSARAGHHLAPAGLSDGRNVFDVLDRDGLTLLAFDADPEPFERASKTVGVPLRVIRDTRADERARYDAGLVLVRPDAFVACAGESEAGDHADAMIRRIVGV